MQERFSLSLVGSLASSCFSDLYYYSRALPYIMSLSEDASSLNKRKRSLPSKLVQSELESPPRKAIILHVSGHKRSTSISSLSSSLEEGMGKRPRGRPPVKSPAVKPVSSTGKQTPKASISSSKSGASLTKSILQIGGNSHSGKSRPSDTAKAVSSLPAKAVLRAYESTNTTGDQESGKQTRPPAALVTQRVLYVLMADGVLSANEICNRLGESMPKDLVQSVLDIMQVTGIVEQLKVTLAASAATSTVYSLAGYARGSEAIDIHKLRDVVQEKRRNAEAVRKRIEILEALDAQFDEATPEDRSFLFRDAVGKIISEDSTLQNDALYRTLADSLERKIQ